MNLPIRKTVEVVEEVQREGGRAVEPPSRIAAVLVVIENPLAGLWTDDFDELIETYCEPLGTFLGSRCAALLGAPPEAFGKGALVGLDGEIEHGSAIVHNLRFGNPIRDAAGGAKSLIPSAEKRGAAGASLDLALKHVEDTTIRSHHQTFEVRIPDAPRSDELVIAAAFASTGRPQARLAPFGSDFAEVAGGSP